MTRRTGRSRLTVLAVVVAIATGWGCYVQTWDGDYTMQSLMVLPAIVAAGGLALMLVPSSLKEMGAAVAIGALMGPVLMFAAGLAYFLVS